MVLVFSSFLYRYHYELERLQQRWVLVVILIKSFFEYLLGTQTAAATKVRSERVRLFLSLPLPLPFSLPLSLTHTHTLSLRWYTTNGVPTAGIPHTLISLSTRTRHDHENYNLLLLINSLCVCGDACFRMFRIMLCVVRCCFWFFF